MAKIGLLHPGQMGAAVGGALTDRGHTVFWASTGRSEDTAKRAVEHSLTDARTVDELCDGSQTVLSICPPHAAVEVATEVAATNFSGTFVDANAVAPQTATEIADIVQKAGAEFVDADIIGGPPRRGSSTTFYVSGLKGSAVVLLFDGTDRLRCINLGDSPTAASALKMCFAAYTKGHAAMLIAIRALARSLDVEDELMEEWDRSMGDLAARSEASAFGVLPKAWRFEGEMTEIANTFESQGIPDGFHRAAAEIYRRLAGYRDAEASPELEEVLKRIRSS